jgi:hypothetical protein
LVLAKVAKRDASKASGWAGLSAPIVFRSAQRA